MPLGAAAVGLFALGAFARPAAAQVRAASGAWEAPGVPAAAAAARAALPAATAPDSLRVLRPMTQLERGVVAVATGLGGTTWGLGGAAAGGVAGLAACAGRSTASGEERFHDCRAERWLAVGGAAGGFVGAMLGASTSARRLGCDPRESRRRAFRGAAVGSVIGLAPAAAYAASGRRSLLVEAAFVFAVPALQITGAARAAGRCRLPVPILR
jgi:hypothetical protein